MLARLALLSPGNPRGGTSIFTVEELDEDDMPVRNLYQNSIRTTLCMQMPEWTTPVRNAQTEEAKRLFTSIANDGIDGFDLRNEGGFTALPPENSSKKRWKGVSPKDRPLLKGIPALRIYCQVYGDSLVLFYGCCKTEEAWQDCPYARPYAERSRALATAIDEAIRNTDLMQVGGHFDLTNSYTFTIPNNS